MPRKGKFTNRIGEIWFTNMGEEFEIIECEGCYDCTIKFKNGIIQRRIRYGNIKRAQVKNLFAPTIYGVGYIGQGKYKKVMNGTTFVYDRWMNMLRRCYAKTDITYRTCSVDKRWHNFQNFAEWHENKWKSHMIEWELDKDLKIKGNKIYSPETCLFIPIIINSLFKKRIRKSGLPTGVTRSGKKFESSVTWEGSREYRERFDTVQDAFNHYKFHKELIIKQAAKEWKDRIEPEAYQAMYNWIVEITD